MKRKKDTPADGSKKYLSNCSQGTTSPPPVNQAQNADAVLDLDEPTHPTEFDPAGPAPKGCVWQPVCMERCLNLSGGHPKDRLFVEARDIKCEWHDAAVSFCKLEKNAEWLLKAVGENGTKKVDFESIKGP
jgi:hypothetical protein